MIRLDYCRGRTIVFGLALTGRPVRRTVQPKGFALLAITAQAKLAQTHSYLEFAHLLLLLLEVYYSISSS